MIAGTKVIGISIMTIHIIIASGVSVRVSFLTMRALIDSAKAATIESIIPNDKLVNPGWTMISMPIIPTIMAAILLALMISPKKIAAPIVINSGCEKLIAMA